MKWSNVFALVAFMTLTSAGFAQRGDGDSLKSSDVVVHREYEPRVTDAFKMSENPKVSDTIVKIDRDLPFDVRTTRVPTEYAPTAIKPAKMKGEPLNKLYKAYGLVGIGNYLSTRAELVVNNTRSRKWDYGFSAWHHGSAGKVKDRGESGFSDNYFSLYGKKFLYNKIVSGDLNYDLNTLHQYGYNPDDLTFLAENELTAENTAQSYQNVQPRLRFKTYFKDSATLNYDIALDYYHYWDKYTSSEDNVKITGVIDRYFNTEYAKVEALLDFNSYQYEQNNIKLKSNSTIFGLRPSVITGKDKFQLRIGADVTMNSGDNQDFYFYPDVYVKYDLVKDILIPYAGVDGQLKRNNFKTLTKQNAFLGEGANISTENTKYNLYGGLRGEAASNLSFNGGFSFKSVENLALFANRSDTLLNLLPVYNQFDVFYDDATITNLFLEIGFQKTEKYSLLLKGEYFNYNLENQKAAWHLPEFKISFNGRYNIGKKMIVTADVYYIGEREAFTPVSTGNKDYGNGIYSKTLDGLIDLNLGVEYFFNPRWTVFLRMYNLANSDYAYYNEYYQQGITVMAGTSYKFWQDKRRSK